MFREIIRKDVSILLITFSLTYYYIASEFSAYTKVPQHF